MQGLGKKNLEIYGGGNKNTRIWQFIQSKVVAELTQVLRAPRSVHRLKHGNASNLEGTYGNNVNKPRSSTLILLDVK